MAARNSVQLLPEPVLRCYPREDLRFLADAQQAVAESRQLARRSEQLLDEVRRKLRERHPASRVEARHPLAGAEDRDVVWYCYRDGSLLG